MKGLFAKAMSVWLYKSMRDFMFEMDSKSEFVILLFSFALSVIAIFLIYRRLKFTELNYAELYRQSVKAKDEIERLKSFAFSDWLTGLHNRAMLEERVPHTLSSLQNNEKFIIVFLDLDNFKYINDTFGHDWGDKVLCEIAVRLRGAMRPVDTIARLGGDEFVIFANVVPTFNQDSIIAKIAEVFHLPVAVAQENILVKASIGHAMFPDDGLSLDGLLSVADKDMYQQKKARKFLSLSQPPLPTSSIDLSCREMSGKRPIFPF